MAYTKWTATWSSSPSIAPARPARYAKDLTLRFIVRIQLDGDAVRIRLSNIAGKESVRIQECCAALMAEGETQNVDTLKQFTFGGSKECVIPAGAEILSDEMPFGIKRGDDLAVSLYMADMAELASGTDVTGPLSRFWFAEGNHAKEDELPIMHRMKHDTVFFLSEVDVRTSEKASAAVCFGDSITAQSWPDHLAVRGLREGWENLSIIRRGVGGSRVLRQYENLQHRSYGYRGQARFEREVAAAGVDRVFILHGVNDIIHPDGINPLRPWSDLSTAEELIEGLFWYVKKGHEMGVKVYLATIVTIVGWPSTTEHKEGIRRQVNAWIRTQTEADGYVDFDAAIRDPDHPELRAPLYDSGDHLHPSLAGAQAMAESIPEAFLK